MAGPPLLPRHSWMNKNKRQANPIAWKDMIKGKSRTKTFFHQNDIPERKLIWKRLLGNKAVDLTH
jgi:hypothetical protein